MKIIKYFVFKIIKERARTDFITKLSDIQINFYKTNGYNKYKVSLDILKQIAKNNNWINVADEFNNSDDNDVNDENKQNEQEEKDYKTKYEKLWLKYKKLKNSINENENENIVVEEEKININIDVVEDKNLDNNIIVEEEEEFNEQMIIDLINNIEILL